MNDHGSHSLDPELIAGGISSTAGPTTDDARTVAGERLAEEFVYPEGGGTIFGERAHPPGQFIDPPHKK